LQDNTYLMNSDKKKRLVFAPGCALMLYKPELAGKLLVVLNKHFGKIEMLTTCCKHDPGFTEPTEIINVCPGCDKRFGSLYVNATTVSLWELVAQREDEFLLPNYFKESMTILDACPARERPAIHAAIRKLLEKMNIDLKEPANTRTNSTCCGDSFYPQLPAEKVNELMRKRTAEMPRMNVVVYCVSCIQSVAIGGKTPRYLPDLLLGLQTKPKVLPTEVWHTELDAYIEEH
jgi:Fe-S oxidoreductase